MTQRVTIPGCEGEYEFINPGEVVGISGAYFDPNIKVVYLRKVEPPKEKKSEKLWKAYLNSAYDERMELVTSQCFADYILARVKEELLDARNEVRTEAEMLRPLLDECGRVKETGK